MTRPSIVYYECLDDPLDSQFLIDVLHGLSADILSLDSFSGVEVLTLAQKGISEADKLLLIIDSRHGNTSNGLFPLINSAMQQSADVWWLGAHPLAAKVIAMTKGSQYDHPDDLPVKQWISEE